ncbi:MAG: hypothetical protein ABSH12_01830 [Endomicrobiales bacterium]|jgi:multisubunit Na+/H+ antiporter MnhB subunit
MFIADVITALACGFFIVWIVSFVFGTRGPWNSFLWFFLVVSIFAWAGGIWLVPFGPLWRGTSWLPIMLMGILIALLLAAVSPRNSRKPLTVQESVMANSNKAIVNGILWIVIIFLLIFGISHYRKHWQIIGGPIFMSMGIDVLLRRTSV